MIPNKAEGSMRREWAFALAVFSVFAAALMGKALVAPADLIVGGPDMSILYPIKAFWISLLKEGRFEFWNPYTALGTPLVGHPNLAAFTPFNVLHLILPVTKAFAVQDFLHFILASMGAYVLVRTWGSGWEGGVLAGLAYGFSGFNLVHLFSGQTSLWWNAAWTPWALAALRQFLVGRDLGALAGAAIFLSFGFFEGYPQITYYTLMACGLLLLHAVGTRICGFRTAFLGGALLVILFLGLSACLLIPSAVFVARSNRALWGYGNIMCDFLTPGGFRHLVQPDFLGNPVDGTWHGRWGYHEMVQYLGLAPLVLFLLSLPFLRRVKGLSFMVLLTAVFAFLSLGDSTEPSRWFFRLLYDHLPGFSSHRSIGRMRAMTGFGIAAGGGLALGALLITLRNRFPGSLWPGRAARILLVLTAVDLWIFGARFVIPVPQELYAGRRELFPEPLMTRVLEDDTLPRINPGNRINANLFFRLSQLETNDRTVLRGVEELVVQMYDRFDGPLPDLVGLKYFYMSPERRLSGKYQEVLPRHFVNPAAYPRVFLAGGWTVATGDSRETLRRISLGEVDPRASVIVDRPPRDLESRPGIAGEARIVRYECDRVEVACRAERPGLLVLTDTHYPFWTVSVDDTPEPILEAFGVFRAVPLRSPGEHRILFRYRPWDVWGGMAIAFPLLACLGIFLWKRRRGPLVWESRVVTWMGNPGPPSDIIRLNASRSADMPSKSRINKRSKDIAATPPPIPPVPVETAPKAAVLVVRSILLILVAIFIYNVFLKKPVAPASGGKAAPPPASAAIPSLPAKQVETYKNPILVDGIPLARGYQGWGDLGPRENRSVRGLTLTVNNKTYEKGIGTHAPAELQFDLNGRATRFTCLVGADNDGGGANQLVFIVKADDRKLFESPTLTVNQEPVKVDVDVTGARRMVIQVKGDGSWDHADILLPRFKLASEPADAQSKKKK